MSIATISYKSIDNAAEEAGGVAKKLDNYASHLESQIKSKLSSYNGKHTGNINAAKNQISKKINMLGERADKYETYKTDLNNLRDACESTDRAVKSKVSSLTATFKTNNGIKVSAVENACNFLLSKWNSTVAGRWLNNRFNDYSSWTNSIKQSIEDWWDYKGGKQAVKGIGVAVLGVVACVATIIGAIAAFPAEGVIAIVVAVCGMIAAGIGAISGLVDFYHEAMAYKYTNDGENGKGDPAKGKQTSDISSVQDALRKKDSEFSHGMATLIDLTEVVCTVVSITGAAVKIGKDGITIIKNGLRKGFDLSPDVALRNNIFNKQNWSTLWTKMKTMCSNTVNAAKNTFETRDFSKISEVLRKFARNSWKDIKKSYTFDSTLTDKKAIVENYATVVKNHANLSKDVISSVADEEGSILDVAKNVLKNILTTYDKKPLGDTGEAKVKDIAGLINNIISLPEKDFIKDIREKNDYTKIGLELKRKLYNQSEECSIASEFSVPDISLSEIAIPEISMPGVLKRQVAIP